MDKPTTDPPPEQIEDAISTPPEIPIEIISEEAMALIEAACAAATRTMLPTLTQIQRNGAVRSIKSISLLSKKRLPGISGNGSEPVGDIEDSAVDGFGQKKKSKVKESLLHRFRRKNGLFVTDITGTEWCEKQMLFALQYYRKPTKAMKAGIARHAELEEEVVKKVLVQVTSEEDKWALKFLNFIIGANQLLSKGLTRELPLVCFVEGFWMVGKVDEIQMPVTETERYPTLIDTKTREQPKLPSGPQQRNGRLQLMCYKLLWDNLAADKFPAGRFFDFFALNPHCILSSDIRQCASKSGFPGETLIDLVSVYRNTCRMLPPAHDQLLLRYELQEDQSLLGEDRFAYEADWLHSQLKSCLEFWLGEREPNYAPEEERWKCRTCRFRECPINPSRTDDG